eukprot:182247-Amphidinium_carterae.1
MRKSQLWKLQFVSLLMNRVGVPDAVPRYGCEVKSDVNDEEAATGGRHSHLHTHTYTYTYTYTYTHTYTYTYSYLHTDTHTYTHLHAPEHLGRPALT